MISERKLASAVGGKTARACDSCIKKRARWYCAADDAFLCQACDSSIHSAILLARRHERVRLKTASIEQCSDHKPSWNHGFKRKPRTPRKSNKSHGGQTIPIHLVPEIGMEEHLLEENDEHEQLLYRVPIFDPFAAQVCVTGSCNDGKKGIGHNEENQGSKYLTGMVNYDREGGKNVNSGFNQSKKDTEFEAHVECLLREGLGGESFDMETLGLLDCGEKEPHSLESSRSAGTVRLDDAQAVMGNAETDITGETFELNFNDYDSRVNCAVNPDNEDSGVGNGDDVKVKKNISLALDYEAVIAAWADQKSPWINGGRPEIDPNGGWSDCMDARGGIHYQTYGETGGSKILTGMLDGGREERVLRYREKRRTRLFSKKIRYEVRKLNAEKRPRVKGRFVKTESLAANSSENISPFH